MSSCTRTIPSYIPVTHVETRLEQRNSYVPLSFKPGRAQAGDYIYLVHQGAVIGRAKISSIQAVEEAPVGRGPYPDWARWLIWYTGGWERPLGKIAVEGHQGVRYLDNEMW